MEGSLKVVNLDEVDTSDDGLLLPGFRFHPTDDELVGFYLRRKVEDRPLRIDIISDIDIYKYEPWDLPMFSKVGLGDREWYFFCLRGRKYRNSIRPNRVTGGGFWKATGIDKPIYSASSKCGGRCLGLKKSLVYYRGSAGKGVKTDWMMHEFRLPPAGGACERNPSDGSDGATHEAEVWTICRIFKRSAPQKRLQQQYPWTSTDSSPTSSSSSPLHDQQHIQTPNTISSISFDQIPIDINVQSPIMSGPYEHWNIPTTNVMDTSSITSSSNVLLNASDIIRDCNNWEEIGKMVEGMIDPTNTAYDCLLY